MTSQAHFRRTCLIDVYDLLYIMCTFTERYSLSIQIYEQKAILTTN